MTGGLERRYRRLLLLYPYGHRREYGEEMLGVLLAGARPGQRYPRLAETFDLVRCALWARLGRFGTGITDRRWADAAAVFAVLGLLVSAAGQLRYLLSNTLWSIRLSDDLGQGWIPPVAAWLVGLAWVLAAAAVLIGWRFVAAPLAGVAVIGDAALLLRVYQQHPVGAVEALWPLAFAGTVAVAASAGGRGPRGRLLLGWRRTSAFAAAGALVVASAAVDPFTARITRRGDGTGTIDMFGGNSNLGFPFTDPFSGMPAQTLVVVAVLTMLVTVATLVRTDGPLRRRLLALLAPTAALWFVVRQFFEGFRYSSPRFSPPVLLVPEQWVALVLTPIIAFLAAAILVHRRERQLELIHLGRDAEAQRS